MIYTYTKEDDKTLGIFDGNVKERLTLSALIRDKEYLESRVALREAQIAKAEELGSWIGSFITLL